MKITEVCVRNPVFAWMIMLGTVMFGVIAMTRIGVSQFPDVDFPTITVGVTWDGATPEAIEQDVVEIIEEAMVQVEGIEAITSTSRQGSGRIVLELDINRDVDIAMQDVQTRLAQVARRLPPDIEPPTASKTNPEDNPIMWVALSGPYSRQMLADTVRYRVRERLQTVPGVGEVTLGGFLDRNVRIWVDADALDARGLTVSDLLSALRREHVELPAGFIQAEGREVSVRVLGEALDLDELRNLVIAEFEGRPVYAHDVALFEDGFEDERRLSRVNGIPAQSLGIRKQRGSNAVDVARGVRAELDTIRATLPDDMDLQINSDSTRFIENSINDIQRELLIAILLTALVCWLFLGSISSTFSVLLAIPMSLLGTVAVIYFLGFTLNTFTLLGLALAVGIVVDDAIMVIENIFRHREAGSNRITAAIAGTRQIAFAALASSISLVAIFVPIVFMEGVIGRFFLQFGVTLSLTVIFSYIVAVTLAPARAAQFVGLSGERRTRLGRGVEAAFKGLRQAYIKTLKPVLRRPAWVLAGAALVFAGSIYTIASLPREFVPSQDQSRLMVRLQLAVGSNLNETDQMFQRVEAYMDTVPEVERVMAIIGGFGGDVNTGIMFVTLVPQNQRARSQNEIAGQLRRELNSYAGLRAVVQDLSQQGFTARRGFPIEFSVRGPDYDKLAELSTDLMERLADSGVAVDVDSNYQVGMPELRILPDRDRASDLGVPMEDIAASLNALVGGVRIGKFSADGRRLDVRMRLLEEQRSRPEDINRLRVRTSSGELVPLGELVRQEERPALQAISREDRERAISIYANVADGVSQNDALEFVRGLGQDLPEGYSVALGGASVAYQESMAGLIFALIMGVIVAYMVLASQFNSFFHPMTVLTIVPLSVAGAAVSLWAAGQTVNVFSMIGLLLLLGIALKNSIILVDYANQYRRQGLTAREAMTKAGPIRLRPILMTSIATMAAALPASIALGEGGEIRRPMAIGVLGGMFVATLMSLVVVPSFYVFLDDVLAWIKGKTSGKSREQIENEAQERFKSESMSDSVI
jgi:multidrug efflux pump